MYFKCFYADVSIQGFVPFVCENRTKYSCLYCPYITAHRGHMKYHQVKHSGARPFRCNICMKNFTLKSNLGVHLRQVHKAQ